MPRWLSTGFGGKVGLPVREGRYRPRQTEAEKERDMQRRKGEGGLLGNVGDTLWGR